MENLIFFTCFSIFSFITALFMYLTAKLFEYRKPENIKIQTYECGHIINSDTKSKFNIKNYNFLIMFLAFDTISIFLYPILATAQEYSRTHYITIYGFIAILLFGLIFSIKTNFLNLRR